MSVFVSSPAAADSLPQRPPLKRPAGGAHDAFSLPEAASDRAVEARRAAQDSGKPEPKSRGGQARADERRDAAPGREHGAAASGRADPADADSATKPPANGESGPASTDAAVTAAALAEIQAAASEEPTDATGADAEAAAAPLAEDAARMAEASLATPAAVAASLTPPAGYLPAQATGNAAIDGAAPGGGAAGPGEAAGTTMAAAAPSLLADQTSATAGDPAGTRPGPDGVPAGDGAPGQKQPAQDLAAMTDMAKTEARTTGPASPSQQGAGAPGEQAAADAAPPTGAKPSAEADGADKLTPSAQGGEQKTQPDVLPKLDQALQSLAQAQQTGHGPAERAAPGHELARPLPPSAVPVEIGLRALQGLKEFQIRLDPAELGRVDVRLEIGDDKSVTAKVVVDRVETLHLLQRDARTLERAFEQAGLKSSDAGIDISLRDPGQQQRNGRGDAWDGDGQFANRRPAREDGQPDIPPPPPRRMIHAGALDLSV